MFEGLQRSANPSQATQKAPKLGELRRYLLENPQAIFYEKYAEGINWSRDKIIRDIWQNFYDSNGFSVDAVRTELREGNGEYLVTISAPAQYSFNRLFALGVGYKSDPEHSVGGKSEGGKIAPLLLLTKGLASEFQYRSQDWAVDFYLDYPTISFEDEAMLNQQGKRQRVLHAKLKDAPFLEGSSVIIKTKNRAFAERLKNGKDMFYHKDNPDFKHPDIETTNAEGKKVGGFKYHPGKEGGLYIKGQLVEYECPNVWRGIPDFTFWSFKTPETKKGALVTERDRHPVSARELKEIFLPFLIESMTEEEQEMAFWLLGDFFRVNVDFSSDAYDPVPDFKSAGKNFLHLLVKKIASRETPPQFEFEKNYLASSGNRELDSFCASLGKTICESELAKLGMMTTQKFREKLIEHTEVEPTPKQKRRIEILENILGKFFEDYGRELEGLGVKKRRVKLIAGDSKALKGLDKLNPDFVYLVCDILESPDPSSALVTYQHELCHSVALDHKDQYANAFTQMMILWERFRQRHNQLMFKIYKNWEEASRLMSFRSLQEYRTSVAPYLREYERLTKQANQIYAFSFEETELDSILAKLHHALGKIIAPESLGEVLYEAQSAIVDFLTLDPLESVRHAKRSEEISEQIRDIQEEIAEIKTGFQILRNYEILTDSGLGEISRKNRKKARKKNEILKLEELCATYWKNKGRLEELQTRLENLHNESRFNDLGYSHTLKSVKMGDVEIPEAFFFTRPALFAASVFKALQKKEVSESDSVRKAVEGAILVINKLFGQTRNHALRRKILLALLHYTDKNFVQPREQLAFASAISPIISELKK